MPNTTPSHDDHPLNLQAEAAIAADSLHDLQLIAWRTARRQLGARAALEAFDLCQAGRGQLGLMLTFHPGVVRVHAVVNQPQDGPVMVAHFEVVSKPDPSAH